MGYKRNQNINPGIYLEILFSQKCVVHFPRNSHALSFAVFLYKSLSDRLFLLIAWKIIGIHM